MLQYLVAGGCPGDACRPVHDLASVGHPSCGGVDAINDGAGVDPNLQSQPSAEGLHGLKNLAIL
jgi:hypothetical protein